MRFLIHEQHGKIIVILPTCQKCARTRVGNTRESVIAGDGVFQCICDYRIPLTRAEMGILRNPEAWAKMRNLWWPPR